MSTRTLALVTCSVALAYPVFARAQAHVPDDPAPLPPLMLAPPAPEDVARAESLFNAARALEAAGNVAEACSKFAQSRRLAPGVGITLHLADCYERLGRNASAQREFLDGERLARERADRRAEVASARARALEPKVNHVTIELPPAPPEGAAGMQVQLDGAALAPKSLGIALPVDPGDHLIVMGGGGATPRLFTLHVDASNPAATLSAGEWLSGEDLDLVFANHASSAYVLRNATFSVDGHPEYFPEARTGEAAATDNSTVRHARLPVGDHTIEVDLKFEANGYGILSYLRGFSFDVKSQHKISAAAGKRVAVTATAFELGDVTKSLDHRLNVAWHEKAW
jgi:hypothetical protein